MSVQNLCFCDVHGPMSGDAVRAMRVLLSSAAGETYCSPCATAQAECIGKQVSETRLTLVCESHKRAHTYTMHVLTSLAQMR